MLDIDIDTFQIPGQSYPFRGKSGQSRHDQRLVRQEVFELGETYEEMPRRLRHIRSKKALLAIIDGLYEERKLPRPGRLAPRYRSSLICWFCRYAPDYAKPEENTQETGFVPMDQAFPDYNGWDQSFLNF
jgi:hypothetical protein